MESNLNRSLRHTEPYRDFRLGHVSSVTERQQPPIERAQLEESCRDVQPFGEPLDRLVRPDRIGYLLEIRVVWLAGPGAQ